MLLLKLPVKLRKKYAITWLRHDESLKLDQNYKIPPPLLVPPVSFTAIFLWLHQAKHSIYGFTIYN